MSLRDDCMHEVLAAGPVAEVRHCTKCDAVSIQMGPTTVRLDAAACESLWATLGEALIVLQRRLEEPEAHLIFETRRGSA